MHIPRYILSGPNKGAAFLDHIEDVLDEHTLMVRPEAAIWPRDLRGVARSGMIWEDQA